MELKLIGNDMAPPYDVGDEVAVELSTGEDIGEKWFIHKLKVKGIARNERLWYLELTSDPVVSD